MAIVTPMMVLAPAREAEHMVHKMHNIRTGRRRRLARLFASGDERGLRKALHSFFKDPQVKMSALHMAGERHPNMEGWHLAAKALDPFTPFPEPVNWWPEPKARGGYRIVCDLPRPLKATHYMIADALYAQMEVPPFIFNLRGRGRDKAIRGLLEKLNAGYNSYRILDVKDCFQSVNPEVFRKLPLPRRIIENALIIENLSLQRVTKLNATEPGSITDTSSMENIDGGPAGLMQGSPASNVILAWLLREAPCPDGEDWLLCIYADDLIVVAKQDDILDRVEQMLVDFFTCPRLGPLVLRKKAAGTGGAFDYLGCEFSQNSTSGIWTLDFSQRTWDRLAQRRHAEIMEHMKENPQDIFTGRVPEKHEKSLRGFASSFPLEEGQPTIHEMARMIGPDHEEIRRYLEAEGVRVPEPPFACAGFPPELWGRYAPPVI